ncbi:hypothetical protein Taro_032310 [Colocasia esculenta]|uniref:Uncharacterized protein n=1 Tax=Colocasia esculenta TaxID=4460 RepID=A0A843VSD0_COLES|nr:hypothetical protein [Colocasia esculenta]
MCPGQALPLGPSGRERGWLSPCVQWPKFRSWVPVRNGTGVYGFPTLRCVQGPGWFCLWVLDLVEFLLLWPVRDW